MSTITDFQKQAINAPGNVLVSAGAGTGKTRTLVERCLRLVVEDRCSLEKILMVTFTEAAAAEMRARLRGELEKRRDQLQREPTPSEHNNGSAAQSERLHWLEEQLAL